MSDAVLALLVGYGIAVLSFAFGWFMIGPDDDGRGTLVFGTVWTVACVSAVVAVMS